MSHSYRPDIDGLRALAVLPVVLGHAGLPGFDGGFVGVDVFFVISGFLIASILVPKIREQRFSLLEFYLRRARRLLPALFTVIAASLLMGWVIMSPSDFDLLGRSVLAVLGFGANIWMWRNTGDYFGAAAEITPMLHTWSLSVEEQFYLIFPLVVVAIARCTPRFLHLVFGAGTVGAFFAAKWLTDLHTTAAFYLMPARMWEFGVGILLFLLPLPKVTPRCSSILTTLGIGLLAFAVGSFSAEVKMPGSAALIPVFGAALVIFGGRQSNPVSTLIGSPILVAIGVLSYSLYLWHWPVQVAMRLVSGYFHLPFTLALTSVAIAMLLAYATHRWIEEPFRKEERWPINLAVLGPSCIGLICLSVAIAKGQGVDGRINDDLLLAYQSAVLDDKSQKNCMDRSLIDGPCFIGAAEGAQLMFWGDSHAGAILPAISDWGKSSGYQIAAATKAGCPPILGVDRVDRPSSFGCAAHNAAVVHWLTGAEGPDTVVLHARWPLVLTSERNQGEAGGPQRFIGAAGDRADPEEELVRTVSHLRSLNKRVVILGPVPELGFDAPRAFLARTRLGMGLPAAPIQAQSAQRIAMAESKISKIAQRYGATYIPLHHVFNVDNPAFSAEGLLYKDDDHLSNLAAHSLILPKLMRDLSVAVQDGYAVAMHSAE